MKVAVVGSSGFIASRLVSVLKREKIEVLEITHALLDLEYPDKFDYSLLKGIDFVVVAAAISSPDKCANEYDYCWSINVNGTKYLIKEALKQNCKVLFFSSDAVYGDIKGKIYDEKSETLPKTSYGRMKKAVEDEFLAENNFKVIRLSYVVSRFDKFTSYCLKSAKENKNAEIFHPFYRNCITLNEVIGLVIYLFHHWNSITSYVINACGSELVSRIRIVDEINRICKEKICYRIVSPENSFYLNRPMITEMKSLYFKEMPCYNDASFSERIKKELEVEYER